jgi:long-chain acyl-CoA synthetase
MNVVSELLSGKDPSNPAVLAGDKILSYGELAAAQERLALALLSSGLTKGERVGLWSENNPFFVIAYLAIIRAGLVVVPFQTDISQDTFNRIVRDAGIKAVLASKRHAQRLKPWLAEVQVPMLAEPMIAELAVNSSIQFPAINPESDLASLMFTSGSTGIPKGVMVSHRNIRANTCDIVSYLGLGSADRVMVVLPFYYCFGLSLLHSHLMAGASLVLNNQFMYPEMVLEDMLARNCTGLAGVPSTYQILLRKSRFKEIHFPALRWFQQAGGKLPNPFIQEIIQTFPQVKYYLMYGQTEATARLSYLPPERLQDKLGSIGKGLPSTKLEVLKPEGKPVAAGTDEVGEIVASGPNITLGYWNDPVETAKFFREGKLYTGDLARVDDGGFIYLVERDREMIKCGGNRVSAKEVEDVIAEIGAIVEVAVIGVPHELLGEAIKAFVVKTSDSNLTAAEVIEHCRRRLPIFKSPESVDFLDKLPHTSSGKVMKRKLKAMTVGATA